MIRHFEANGFTLLREGKKHSIYTDGQKVIPVKRHRTLERIAANELWKQAAIEAKF